MDIRNLVEPSNSAPRPVTQSPVLTERHSSLSEDPSSPPNPPLSRRQTVSSLLNEDESDYLNNRSSHVNSTSTTTPPQIPSHVISSPAEERSQSPLAKRPLMDSPGNTPRVEQTSPHLPKRPRLNEDTISPKSKSSAPGNTTLPIRPTQSRSSSDTSALEPKDHLSSVNAKEEGKSSPPIADKHPSHDQTVDGHLPQKTKSDFSSTDQTDAQQALLHPQPSNPNVAHDSKPSGNEMNSTNNPNGDGNGNGHVKPSGEPTSRNSIENKSINSGDQVQPRLRKDIQVPVWARNFRVWKGGRRITLVNGSRSYDNSNRQRPPPPSHQSSTSASYTNNISQVPSASGLPLSLTSVLPYEDITRRITTWLFAKLTQLEADRRFVEVEVKVGGIFDKKNDKRINLPILTESVLNFDFAKAETYFRPGVSDLQFKSACSLFDKIAKETKGTDMPTRIAAMPTRSTTDRFFNHPKTADRIRQTVDDQGNQVELMVKRTIDHLVVFSPGDLMDYRISVSVEIPQNPAEIDLSALRPVNERHKNRLAFVHSALEVDLTSVTSGVEKSHEIELEFNKDMLVEHFEGMSRPESAGVSSQKFEELIRFAVDNTRLIMRTLSR